MPQPKKIKQDGKDYTFTPGANPSLTAPAPKTADIDWDTEPVAKTVPSPLTTPNLVSDDTKRRRRAIVQTLASRG